MLSYIIAIALQRSVDIFSHHSSKLSLLLSSQKCRTVLFTLRPHNPILARIHHNKQYLNNLHHFKYLSIILDSRLSWKNHIQYLKNRAFNATSILKSPSPSKWGGDPSIVILFYKSFIRSIMDYRSILFANAPNPPSPYSIESRTTPSD